MIYKHLSGKATHGEDVVGVYPILPDDTCCFLAIDFDDGAWQSNVLAVRKVCADWNIPCAVERSRSGEGAHLWIFFSAAGPCSVDEVFTPYPDQWAYLSALQTMTANELDALIHTHCHGEALGKLCSVSSEAKPWEKKTSVKLNAMDFYGLQQIIRSNMIYLPADGFSPRARNQLLRLAAFRNPEFYKAQAMRLSNYKIPRIICAAEERDGYLTLPRCCEEGLVELLENASASYEIIDRTCPGNPVRVHFNGTLREEQQPAADALLAHDNGVLSATTAFGKTVIAAYLIGQRKVNTLVLVNTQALLNQWKRSLSEFLEINEVLPELPKKRGRKKERSLIGQLGGSKNTLSGFVDIAIMQALVSDNEVRDLVKDYGMVIVDECHHVSAVNFERVLKEVNAKYVYGLTATPVRHDGHQPIIHMQCGPIRYRVDAKAQAEKRPFDHAVIPRFTAFSQPLTLDKPWTVQEAYATMQNDEARNAQIISDVLETLAQGRTPLVLSERYDHAKLLASMLSEKAPKVVLLSGKGSSKEKRELLQELSQIDSTDPLILVATGRYVGEGFDLPRLDTLFLAMPISWKGTLAQYAGRLHRSYDGKQEVLVYDYVDLRIPMLERMYQRRLSGYASIGYSIRGDRNIPAGESRIFTQDEYWSVFSDDIRKAAKSLLIVSPYLHMGQVKRVLAVLSDDIKVTVVTNDESGFKPEACEKIKTAIALLEQNGVSVELRPKVYQRFAIIDRELLWYGGINFLGFEKAANGAMRLYSGELAIELMNTTSFDQQESQIEMHGFGD